MHAIIKATIAGLLGASAFAAAADALPASQIPDEFPYIWVQYNNPDHSGGVQKRIARVVLEDGGEMSDDFRERIAGAHARTRVDADPG